MVTVLAEMEARKEFHAALRAVENLHHHHRLPPEEPPGRPPEVLLRP
jgi:hypothetical protein